jgi:hypothetical protein
VPHIRKGQEREERKAREEKNKTPSMNLKLFLMAVNSIHVLKLLP